MTFRFTQYRNYFVNFFKVNKGYVSPAIAVKTFKRFNDQMAEQLLHMRLQELNTQELGQQVSDG